MDFAVWVVQIALERCQVIFYDTGEYSFAQFKIPVISVYAIPQFGSRVWPADPLPASHHARHIKGFRTDRDGIRGHCVLLHICDIAVYTGGKGQDQCNADDANGTSNRC